MKKSILVSCLIIIFSLFIISVCFAGSNKITTTNTFYSAFDPNDTHYVYDPNKATGATSGQYLVENYDEKVVQVRIPTLGSTSIDFRIEGQVDGASTWANVYSKNYSAATTVDELIMITEQLKYIRIGLKVNTDGTDSVTVIGNFSANRRLR